MCCNVGLCRLESWCHIIAWIHIVGAANVFSVILLISLYIVLLMINSILGTNRMENLAIMDGRNMRLVVAMGYTITGFIFLGIFIVVAFKLRLSLNLLQALKKGDPFGLNGWMVWELVLCLVSTGAYCVTLVLNSAFWVVGSLILLCQIGPLMVLYLHGQRLRKHLPATNPHLQKTPLDYQI